MSGRLHFLPQHFIVPGHSRSLIQPRSVEGDFGHKPCFDGALLHLQTLQPRESFTKPYWQYIIHITGLHARTNRNCH